MEGALAMNSSHAATCLPHDDDRVDAYRLFGSRFFHSEPTEIIAHLLEQ